MSALWLVASLPLAPAIGVPVGLWLRRRFPVTPAAEEVSE